MTIFTLENLEIYKDYINNEEAAITFLAIDPGKSNGICGYNKKYELQFMWTINADDIILFLKEFKKVQICVVEDFKLYPNKAREQYYSDMQTSRVIGRIENWAQLGDVELVKQNASIKKNGYAWIGQKPLPKTNPMNHVMDAHVHFMYWAVRKGRVNAATLLQKVE